MLALLMAILWQPLLGAPSAQTAARPPAELLFPIIAPGGTTAATLHTHIASIALATDDQGVPAPRIDATYDIRNDGKEELSVPLLISNAAQFELTLTQDGAPVAVTLNTDGSGAATITAPAGGRTELALTARTGIDQPLLRLVYPTEQLRTWRGQRSIRVELTPLPGANDDANRDGWLRIEPNVWRYQNTGEDLRLEWLFEGEIPLRVLFQTVSPANWQEIQATEAAATGNAPQAYATLGARYQQLADAAAALSDGEVQARFAAQAIAAYGEGIRQAELAGAAATDLADLHAGLAALYRTRVSATSEIDDARAMVAEAGLALRGVMVDDPRRRELEQWQVDGLRLILADLRGRGDIAGALALIEELRTLPAGDLGSDFLAEERAGLIVQQAVEFIERGDRAGALALAGDVLNNPELQPPTSYRNLFTRWNVSTTMSTLGVEVQIEVDASEERSDEASEVLTAIVDSWKASPPLRAMSPQLRQSANDAGDVRFTLQLHLPVGANGVALAQALPATADWALLRTLLNQLGPQITTTTRGVWQQIELSQPIDLRAAGEQWQQMAAELERQAGEFEAAAVSTATDLPRSQQERLRAANYRYAAQAWRRLVQDSQVIVALSTPGALNAAPRSWLVTVDSPPQLLNVQAEAVSSVRILGMALAALSAIFGLAALLWRLL